MCASYNRILSVLNALASGVCSQFALETAVCPLNFSSDVFTMAAVDNLDHNPSATSAHSSFHGTGIVLHQHQIPSCYVLTEVLIVILHLRQ